MLINFLGTGSAFTLKNWQSNILITHNGANLLFDAGGDLRHAMHAQTIPHTAIDAVYLSHNHFDHSAGLEWLGFVTFFDPSCKKKVQLFGDSELLRKAWDTVLKGSMESIQGRTMYLGDYFDLCMVRPAGTFFWQGLECQLTPAEHIWNGRESVPSHGLMIKVPVHGKTKNVYITSDRQFVNKDQVEPYLKADLIIQDCETGPYKSKVHAHFTELVTLPEDIKKKMILTHYNDNILDSEGNILEHWLEKAHESGFELGFAKKQHVTDLEELLK